MSARQTFAYCADHHELHLGVPDRNGVYQRDSESSNHWDCSRVHVFGPPDEYAWCPIIRRTLAQLGAGISISNNEIVLFKLALALEDVGDPDAMRAHQDRRTRASQGQEALL